MHSSSSEINHKWACPYIAVVHCKTLTDSYVVSSTTVPITLYASTMGQQAKLQNGCGTRTSIVQDE